MLLTNSKLSYLFTFLIACFFAQYSNAQDVDKLDTHKAYDALVQPNNTGYFNGPEFQDIYLTNSNSDRYFQQFDFLMGSIVYNNQEYFNVYMKYDIHNDQIITRSNDALSLFKVNLNAEKISEFTIYNRKFVTIPELSDNMQVKFYEVAYKGNNVSLYIKHYKEKKETTVNFTLRFDFTTENYYVLHKSDSYQKFKAIKDLKKLLPQQAKQIQDYYKSHNSVYKSDKDTFMVDLFKSLKL